MHGSSDGPAAECGNDIVDGDEVCDGTDLGGHTCASEGFDAGTLACTDDCTAIDTRGCTTFTCGNDVVEGAELCDGRDLAGQTCVTLGFDAGSLACSQDCTFDTSACFACGNDTREGDEVCDGTDLGGQTCVTLGFDAGSLACSQDCTFDTSACVVTSGALLTVRTTDDMLRAFDPDTLAFEDIGSLGVAFEYGDLAWDASTDTLWMVDGRPLRALYTVDIDDGAATLVGVHDVEDLFGLAWDASSNTLYGGGETPFGFYEVDRTDGTAALVGVPDAPAHSLTYDSKRDQIVAIVAGLGTLFTIDRQDGSLMAVLSEEGFINNCGLAYDPKRDLYWAIDLGGDLFTYHPDDGYTRQLVATGLGQHEALTFVPGYVVGP